MKRNKMQREIKFRGQTLNGNFVHGTYAYDGYNHKIVKILDDGKPAIYQVDPKTIGQYTGLKAKNGDEIYEDDFLAGGVSSCGKPVLIEWQSKRTQSLGHDLYHINKIGFLFDEYYFTLKDCEIVGNIHDNPELLEKL